MAITMYLGVVVGSRAEHDRFLWTNWRKPGHQHYLIRHDGYTVSHDDPAVNFAHGSLRITVGDTVTVEFDSTLIILRFICREKEERLKVAALPQSEYYRFVVYLLSSGDSVQILPSD